MSFFFGQYLVESVFERSGKHKLPKFVAFGGSGGEAIFLYLNEDSIENFIVSCYRKTNKGIWGGGCKRDG